MHTGSSRHFSITRLPQAPAQSAAPRTDQISTLCNVITPTKVCSSRTRRKAQDLRRRSHGSDAETRVHHSRFGDGRGARRGWKATANTGGEATVETPHRRSATTPLVTDLPDHICKGSDPAVARVNHPKGGRRTTVGSSRKHFLEKATRRQT